MSTGFRDMTPEEMTFPGEKERSPENECTESLLVAGTPEFYLCGEHHPFIGPKRNETRSLLSPFHKKLEFHFITPNPFM